MPEPQVEYHFRVPKIAIRDPYSETNDSQIAIWDPWERKWYIKRSSRIRDRNLTEADLREILEHFNLSTEDHPLDLVPSSSAYELEAKREAKLGRIKRTYVLIGRQLYDHSDGSPVSDHETTIEAYSSRDAIEQVTPYLSKAGSRTLTDGEITASDEVIWRIEEM